MESNPGYLSCFLNQNIVFTIITHPRCVWADSSTQMIMNFVFMTRQMEDSCRNTNFITGFCKCLVSCKFSDVSWLVFWSMNQVGGISCLRCFPVIVCHCKNPQSCWALCHSNFFFWNLNCQPFFLRLLSCEIFCCPVSVAQPVCLNVGRRLFLALSVSSYTDAIIFNPSFPTQHGGECP